MTFENASRNSNVNIYIFRHFIMSTIKDVAELARVSTATVSRVINSPAKVRAGTRERVQQATDTLTILRQKIQICIQENSLEKLSQLADWLNTREEKKAITPEQAGAGHDLLIAAHDTISAALAGKIADSFDGEEVGLDLDKKA